MSGALRLFTATLPDGQQVLVSIWGDAGAPTYAEIAFRPEANQRITWGAPTVLEEQSS